MSIKHIETKSETGRSGIRVEYDSSMDVIRLSGFYDTYVKLRLKKNEWKLEEFLDFLGINDILSKKLKITSINNTVETEKVKSPDEKTIIKKVSNTKSKSKVSKDLEEIKDLSNLTKETFEFEHLPKVQLSYSLKKTSEKSRNGSIQVNISIGSDRTRFIIPNGNGHPMALWISDKKLFDVKHRDYTSLYNAISHSINQCKMALEIKSKEIQELKNLKKTKSVKLNLEPKEILKYIKNYCFETKK